MSKSLSLATLVLAPCAYERRALWAGMDFMHVSQNMSSHSQKHDLAVVLASVQPASSRDQCRLSYTATSVQETNPSFEGKLIALDLFHCGRSNDSFH